MPEGGHRSLRMWSRKMRLRVMLGGLRVESVLGGRLLLMVGEISVLGRGNGDGELRERGGDWFGGGFEMWRLCWLRMCGRRAGLGRSALKVYWSQE